MPRIRTRIASLTIGSVLAACGGGGGTPCKDAIVSAATRFDNADNSAVATLIGMCEQTSWPAERRACLAAAATPDALEACMPALDLAVPVPVLEPTPETLALVTEPIKVLLFFGEKSEVQGILAHYFAAIPRVTVELHDRFIDMDLARKYNMAEVALVRGEASQALSIVDDVDAAMKRDSLRHFDADVGFHVRKLLSPPRVGYTTSGHGELTDGIKAGVLARRLPEMFARVAKLVPSDLAVDVPADATAVFVFAPVAGLSAPEWAALDRYLDRGGALFVAADPTAPASLGPLEAKLGVHFNPAHLFDDSSFYPLKHDDADHRLVLTSAIATHRTTAAVSGKTGKLLLNDAGTLEVLPPAGAQVGGPQVTVTVQSEATSYLDLDGDGHFSAATEKRGQRPVAAAIEGPTFRALVFADQDLFADIVAQNRAVMLGEGLFFEGVRWLTRMPDPGVATEGRLTEPPGRLPARIELAERRLLRAYARALAAPPREREASRHEIERFQEEVDKLRHPPPPRK